MADYISKDGHLYTIDEINQVAEENGTTFEDIIEKNALSQNEPAEGPGKKKPVAAKGATVTGKSTASKSARPSSVSSSNPFGKVNIFDPLNITKNALDAAQVKPTKEVKFNPKKFAKDMSGNKAEGFYTKGEKNVELSGVKQKKAEEKVADEVFNTFDTFNYSKLTPEQKLLLDDQAANLLQSNIKVGESYSLSPKDIELKSQEILSKAAEKKKGIEESSYLDRFVNGIAAGANYVGESFASMPETVYRVFALPQNIVASITDNKDLEASPEKLKELTGTTNPVMDYFVEEQKKIQKNNNIYDNANYDSASISENLEKGNWSDAFKLLGTGLAESAPVSISIMAGGANMGLAKLAATSTALMAGPETRKIAEENPNQSELENVVTGFGMAGAESVFSAIGEGSLGKVLKQIIKKEGAEIGAKTFRDGLITVYETALKKYGAPAAMIGEGIEEVATTITQNLISKKPAFENVTDSFIAGVGGGAVWGSPVNLQKGIQGFKKGLTTYKVNQELKNTDANNLTEVFNPNTPVTDSQINIASIPDSYKILNEQVDFDINSDRITPEEGDKIKKEFAFTYHANNKLKELKLPTIDNIEVINLLKQRDELNSTIKAVNDPTLTPFQIDEVKAINSKISEITAGAAKQNITADIEKTKRAADAIGVSEYIEIPDLNNASDVREYLVNNADYLDEKTLNLIETSYGAFVPLKNGKEALIINKEEAALDRVVTTGQHEFLHKIVYKAVKDNVQLQKKIGSELYSHLENYIGEDQFKDTEFKKRYDGYKFSFEESKKELNGKLNKAKEYLAKGSINQETYDKAVLDAERAMSKAEGKYLEETLPLLSESLSKGDIKYNETFFTKIGDILRKIFQKYGLTNVSFDNGKDVFNFVRDYNKSFESGKFTKAFKTLVNEGQYKGSVAKTQPSVKASPSAEVKQSQTISQVETLKNQLSELEDNEFDYEPEDFDQQVANLQEKIKRATEKEKNEPKVEVKKEKPTSEEDDVKEIIRENKASVASDKVQKIYDAKGKEGAQDIINLFRPITKKIVDKRRDAPGFDRELLTDEIETGVGGILDLITKYNPESGIPLAAYINKYLPVRAIATSKRILDTEFSKDVTEEKGLMAEETTSEAKEKPKYANALESKVFEPEVLENANKKILSVVRTLKSKIDEPITLNRTVTPLIAEIKDEIGKQFDIDVKTAMGGKKDNQLKNWLLKNKKYILENMTTTWLMGKGKANKVEGGIPNAIQKQIDGKWVSYPDWVGKTPDRESVSTDQAGRTSGAELVRRLPNVANNVSNEDFLSHILEPSGNPIRGRKESLAKAIAEESAFDIINNDLENEGPIYDAMLTTQERLGAKIANDLAVEIAKQSERGNIKYSEKLINGYNESIDKLSKDILKAETAKDETNIINKWIASDGRSIRTIASFLKGKLEKLKTNRGIFENILLPTIKTYSKFKGTIEKNSYNLVSVPKGESIYFGDEKVPLWLDINYIKNNWNKAVPVINEEANEAVNEMIDIVNYFKDNKSTKENFEDYLGLLRIDQRGLIRKMFKAGLAVENMDKSLEPYLEHNATNASVANKIMDFFNEKITEKELRDFITEAQVNLVPKKMNDYLPKYEEGKNRMHAPKAVLYLQSLIDKGYKISNIESEYGSKKYFDALVKLAKSGVNSKEVIDNQAAINKILEDMESDVKSSEKISPTFNKIIEENKGVEDYKNFSDIVARRRGAGKNRFDIYVPASAADFELLLYNFMGEGKKGEEQKKFFTDTLLRPYANGNDLMDAARQSIKNEYKQLLTEFPDVAKKIEKRTPDGDFTYDQAIRVAMWNDEGVEIPGLSQRDTNKLTELVNNDPELKAFKEGLIVTGRQGRGWVKPEEYWDANTIITDLHNLTEGEGRKKFLSEFIANAEEMFGKWENGKLVGPNINKVEAVYGTDVREALEDVLYRMTTGKNRGFGKDKETSNWANWVTGSTGAIMFLNVRSAALQLIGAVNFLNLRDNNPYAAAKAFANQKQYWEDFARIWNSDKMKERRGGLKEDVAAAEIANAAAGSKNKVGAVLSYLLKVGYTPTQMADSFAIASGGAPFYRNRIKTYLSEGMTEREAEDAAWDDFTKVSDETQQSGDPRDISKQQASAAGRLLLTFQNTAMQQSRIVKKAFLDLKNGRGDAKTNFAKIAYYIAIQNTMFAVLQQGLFAVAFGDDDEDEEKPEKEKKLNEKLFDVADGVVDTILRGTGFTGGIVATVKNMAKKYLDERDKKFKADYAKVVLEGANLSPPIGSKLRKLYSGLQQTKFDKDLIEKRGWDVVQDGRVKLSPSYGVTGKIVEAFTNVPMDRLVTKVNNASEALNSQNTAMQRIMVGLGWSPYSAGIEDSAGDKKIREEAKAKRKIEGVEKAKETRERTKDSIKALPLRERIKLKRQAVLDRREKRKRRKMG